MVGDTPVAVVTGGAAGIGQAYRRRLAQYGCAVAIADLAHTEEIERLISEVGGTSFFAPCDVRRAQR